jgi:hypothetical protein
MMPHPAPAVRISFCGEAQLISRQFRCTRPPRVGFGQTFLSLENRRLSDGKPKWLAISATKPQDKALRLMILMDADVPQGHGGSLENRPPDD